MKPRVAINGFGRMGKLGLRIGFDHPDYDIIHINEPTGEPATHAHLLEFDSVHGRWSRVVTSAESTIQIEGREISVSNHVSPAGVDWAALGIDLVLECSGKFKTEQALAPYFCSSVKKVLVSAPCPEPALNLVMGVNEDRYDPAQHDTVTAASCTTNCLAPMVSVMHESLGIRHGSITTIHAFTNTQTILDKSHKDLRRARACGGSLIPTSTGSAKAIIQIFPELEGRLDGIAVRVPLANASLTDFVFESERETTVEEVNQLFAAAAEQQFAYILGFEERPLVSVDYRSDPRSCIVDAARRAAGVVSAR